LASLAVLIIVLSLVMGFLVVADEVGAGTGDESLYEYYITSDDAGATTYGYAWVGQTFTTGAEIPHTVSMVRVKLYRVGSPGLLTAYIFETTGSLPTGLPLAEGILNADGISNGTGGGWYFIDLDEEVYLDTDTEYALVLEVQGGDSGNAAYWRYDNGNGYADGQCVITEDGGGTWGNMGANDMMFEIWGHLGVRVLGVNVFSDFIETGDQLYVFYYQVIVGDSYMIQNPINYFNTKLLVSTTLKAQMKLPSWDLMPGSFYLNEASALEWVGNLTLVEISGITGTDFAGDAANYTLVASDWIGSDLELLDDWVFATARYMEDYYGETLIVSMEGRYLLNDEGSTIFARGIPGLVEYRPDIFGAGTLPGLPSDEEFTTDYQDTLEDQFGETGLASFASLAELTGTSTALIGGLFWMSIVLLAVYVVGGAVGNFGVGILIAPPMVFVGSLLGLIPLVYVILPIFLVLVYMTAKFTWWRA